MQTVSIEMSTLCLTYNLDTASVYRFYESFIVFFINGLDQRPNGVQKGF